MRFALLGRQALGIAADVTSEADVQRLFEEIFATFPQVNILINNAGGGRGGNSVTACSADAWDAVIDKNLRSTFLCCRAVASHMRERRSGKIINVASVAALRPLMPVLAPYAVAKAGIIAVDPLPGAGTCAPMGSMSTPLRQATWPP